MDIPRTARNFKSPPDLVRIPGLLSRLEEKSSGNWIAEIPLTNGDGCSTRQQPSTTERSNTNTEVNNTKVVQLPGETKMVVVNRNVPVAPPTTNVKVSATSQAPSPAPAVTATATPTPTTDTGVLKTETQVTLSAEKLAKSLDAKGRDVRLESNGSTLTLTGSTVTLSISGENNTVTVENARSIDVTGKNNQVHWSGSEPTVQTRDESNRIAKQ